MKILGAIATWNNLEFFRPSLLQALELCDEVIVAEGCHSKQYPPYSTDGTKEFLATFQHPKLQILNIDIPKFQERYGRYDFVQWKIREQIKDSSEIWQPGNWIMDLDDDIFWLDKDLEKIRKILETTSYDRVGFKQRKFTYNFRFNSWVEKDNPISRITEGCFYTPIASLCYKNGTRYIKYEKKFNDITTFHYASVKKPERMNARWVMSIEKGTSSSKTRFKKWMGIEWENDKDFLKHKDTLAFIFGANPSDVHIYDGKHPEILDSHPWRHIKDVRKLEK